VDVELTARVIECLPKTVKGFLQLSSVIAYGLGTEGMIDEFTPTKPVTFMDKAAAERDALINTLCETRAVPWLVLQPGFWPP